MCGAHWVIAIPRELRPDERRSLVHALAWASAAGWVGLLLLAAWPYWYVGQWNQVGGARLFLLLIPSAVPVASAAFVIVAALAARSQLLTRRVLACLVASSLLVTMVSIVVSGWVLPVTNQSARVLVFNHDVWRGLNELRFDELYTLAVYGTRPPDLPAQAVAGASLALHGRLAFAASPVLFALLALRLARRTARRVTVAVTSLLTLVVYVIGMMLAASSELLPVFPWLQAWLPDAAVLVLAHLVRTGRTIVSATA
jgi:hypothetical protein